MRFPLDLTNRGLHSPSGAAAGGGGGTIPAVCTLQYALDGDPVYETSPLGGVQVLRSLETYDTLRVPRKGRCYGFDGGNDHGALGSRLVTGSPSQLTITCWLKTTDGSACYVSQYNTSGNQQMFYFGQNSAGRPFVILSADGGSVNSKFYSSSTVAVNDGTWHHVAFVFDSNTLTIYVDGASVPLVKSTDGTVNTLYNGTAPFLVARQVNGTYYGGYMSDLRVYSDGKSASEILAISGGTVNNTNLLAQYNCNEEGGTTAYDASGNGKHLTLTNITVGTFHAEDTELDVNPANRDGSSVYATTVSKIASSVIFPRESNQYSSVTVEYEMYMPTPALGDISLFGDFDGTEYAFIGDDGSSSTAINSGSGTPSLYIDGVLQSPVNRNDVYDLVPKDQWTTIKITNLDLSGYSRPCTAYYVGSYTAEAFYKNLKVDFTGDATWDVESATGDTNGFSLGGSASERIVPADTSDPTVDVTGETVTYAGQSPYPIAINVPCGTFDGVNDRCPFAAFSETVSQVTVVVKQVSTNQEILAFQDSTDYGVRVTAGTLSFGATLSGLVTSVQVDGRTMSSANAGEVLNDLQWHTLTLNLTPTALTKATIAKVGPDYGNIQVARFSIGDTKGYWSFQEGDGTTIYDCSGNGNDGTLYNVTTASFWANTTTYEKDHSLVYGGAMSVGVFIPGLLTESGTGKIINENTTVDRDPFDAAELNGLGVDSAFAIGSNRQVVSPANTKFARSDGGDDRLVTTCEALTGDDLTNMEAFVE